MNDEYGYPERKEFLLNLYNQLNTEINRHINLVWQSVAIGISGFAVFALVEKKVISIDFASCIILILNSLGVAMVIEANYWYNRNLVIIANIEKQFLVKGDLHDIHHYFSNHRKDNQMLKMMVIQLVFFLAISILVLIFHFIQQVYSSFHLNINDIDFIKSTPYFLTFVSCILLYKFYCNRIDSYNSFIKKSPGMNL